MLESNDFIIDSISLFVTRKEFILVLVLHTRGGNALLFFVGVHTETKKFIKKICFFAVVKFSGHFKYIVFFSFKNLLSTFC